MCDYSNIRVGKLVLKGEKVKKSKKRKSEKKERNKQNEPKQAKVDEDALKHGGWWQTKAASEISGSVALEFGERCYLKALDNGLFILGPPHREGDGPDPEEIFIAFPINETKCSFKSGYGKYIGVEKNNRVVGRSEAVGTMEQWEPIFENDKVALLSGNGFFMGIDIETDACIALQKKVGNQEIVKIRCNTTREIDLQNDKQDDEKGNLNEIEKNYVKKFQKFQDKKLKISKNVEDLKVAQKEGDLHEKLLDRRSKMKADRYCK